MARKVSCISRIHEQRGRHACAHVCHGNLIFDCKKASAGVMGASRCKQLGPRYPPTQQLANPQIVAGSHHGAVNVGCRIVKDGHGAGAPTLGIGPAFVSDLQ